MLVVLYHAGVQTLSGGFVGVDVFFVISGFLITTHLLESLQTHGRIPFASFYAKRARRILPASLLVAGLTVVAAWLWMPPLLMTQVFEGAVATALYEIGRASCRERMQLLLGAVEVKSKM